MKKLKAEILRIGTWNGIKITPEHIASAVRNFSSPVPLKFGHNKKQKITDGLPALGWVTKVWESNGVLMAQLSDVPSIVFNAIKAKLYRSVSIEGSISKSKGLALKALALIGAELPAVETLQDLQTFLAKSNIDNSKAWSKELVIFSIQSINLGEDRMTLEELTTQLAELKVKFSAQEQASKVKADADAGTIKTLQDKINSSAKEKTALEFTRKKEEVTADLESLTKSQVITPAQRDKFIAEFTPETSDRVMFALDVIKDGVSKELLPKGSTARSKSKQDCEEDTLAPDASVHAKAVAFAAENKSTYSEAVNVVLSLNPKLARAYADQNDQGA